MERFVKGDVVVTPFPFSDLTSSIRRPALIIANLKGDDFILCQITSKKHIEDPYQISLNERDFSSGGLNVKSFIKPSIKAQFFIYQFFVHPNFSDLTFKQHNYLLGIA